MKSLKTELAEQQQQLKSQEPQVQEAADLRTELHELHERLQAQNESKKAQEKQLEEAASLRTRLAEVGSLIHLQAQNCCMHACWQPKQVYTPAAQKPKLSL